MGLLGRGRGRGRGSVARGRAATVWVAGGFTPPTAATGGRGRGRGRGGLFGMGSKMARTLDRRPKVVEVLGWEAADQEELTAHLNVSGSQ